jgi:signal transduction histidine kinase
MFPLLISRVRGLLVQLLILIIVPMLVIVLIVAYSSVSLHDHAMRALVSERDARAAQAAAEVLGDRFAQRRVMLQILAERVADGVSIALLLKTTPDLQRIFDGGLVAVDLGGRVTDSWQPGVDWATRLPSTVQTWILQHDTAQPLVIVNMQNAAKTITLFGGMSLQSLNVPAMIRVLQNNPQTALYLIADDGHLLENTVGKPIGSSVNDIPELKDVTGEAMTSHQPSSIEPDTVTVTSRVETLNWLLVVREAWNQVVNPTLRLSLVAPLAMIPVTLLAVGVLVFGLMRVVTPLQRLRASSARLAWGDYKAVSAPVGGVQEIGDLQATLAHMARRLQQAQVGIHSYIGAMLKGQEDERTRIARELHDDTLQSLIALDQQRQMAQRSLERDPAKTATHLAQLQVMLDHNINNLRRLIRDMRPSYIEDLGLAPALEALCRQQAEATGLTVDFSVSGTSRRLPPDQELALYRIAQEALTNAIRHAQPLHQPLHIDVHLTFEQSVEQPVSLQISDDGQGFLVPERPGAFAQAGHYGLTGIVERAEQIGAQLRIDSTLGKGTTISVSVKSAPEQAKSLESGV